MAKHFFAICQTFAIYFLVAYGKELLCHQPADGKDQADGKFSDSSSDPTTPLLGPGQQISYCYA